MWAGLLKAVGNWLNGLILGGWKQAQDRADQQALGAAQRDQQVNEETQDAEEDARRAADSVNDLDDDVVRKRAAERRNRRK